MAALHQVTFTGSLAGAFRSPWTGRELVFDGANTDAIELFGYWKEFSTKSVDKSSIGYGLSVRFPMEGTQCQLAVEWLEINGQEFDLFGVGGGYSSASSLFRRGNVSPRSRYYAELEHLCEVIRPVHLYSFSPRRMALPAGLDDSRKFRMYRDGFGLPTMLHDILLADARRFLDLSGHFCELFPQFEAIRLETEHAIRRRPFHQELGREEPCESGIGLRLKTKTGSVVRGQHLSDGTLLVLGFLAVAYLPEPPRLLLIEEPENGIYPKRLEEVIRILRRIVEEKEGPQIVFTTHSPFVVSHFQPEEVTFLTRNPAHPGAGVRARPLRDAPNLRERLGKNEFYLGELWFNLSEEEVFGEFPG